MATPRPLICVVTAVYNGSDTLPRLLDSFTSQTWPGREIVVIDGGSTDGTVAILKRYGQHLAAWVSEPDRGIYDAWNKGVERARGDWLCFLGADDYLWDPDALARAAERLAALPDPSLRVAYGQVNLVDGAGKVLKTMGGPWENAAPRFTKAMSIPNPGTFYARSLFDEHGRFDASFRLAGDYEFLLRELKDRPAHYLGEVVVAGMQVAGVTDRPDLAVRRVKEDLRAQRKHGLRRLPVWMSFRLLIERIRRTLERIIGPRLTLRLWNAWKRSRGKPPLEW